MMKEGYPCEKCGELSRPLFKTKDSNQRWLCEMCSDNDNKEEVSK